AASAVRGAFVAVLAYWWLLALAFAGIVGFVLWRRRRAGPAMESGRRAAPRARSAIARAYDQAARALAKAGIVRAPATTPRELAARLADPRNPTAAYVDELTDLYYNAEWGRRVTPVDEDRAGVLATLVRDTLRAR